MGGVTEKEEETVTEGSKEVIEVPQRRLDEIVDGPVTLMKVDVEGAEAWVFQGAEGILESQKVEMICFENNRVRTRRLEIEEDAPFNVLKQYGYDIVERNNTFWAEPRG
jgi:FkbM family methyltransferase